MSEIILPRWENRRNVTRNDSRDDYSDLAGMVVRALHFYTNIYDVVAPYEARQRQTDEMTDELLEYTPPTPEYIKAVLNRPHYVSQNVYDAAVRGMVEFCKINKRMFALPVPHPTTIHSIQLPKGSFQFIKDGDEYLIAIEGCKSTFKVGAIKNPGKVKHVIIRPKSSASGVPNINNWEILTFEDNHGYIPLWVDSTANPRFAGTV